MDLLIQQIEEMPSSSFVGEIVMDKFFLPQYPKQIINVSPTWFDKSFDENKSILEIR